MTCVTLLIASALALALAKYARAPEEPFMARKFGKLPNAKNKLFDTGGGHNWEGLKSP